MPFEAALSSARTASSVSAYRSDSATGPPTSDFRAFTTSVLTSDLTARLRSARFTPARACFFADAVRLATGHHLIGHSHELRIIGPVEFELGGKRPNVHPDAYIAPTAVLIGDVEVASGASVWFGAVLRADEAQIRIGEGSNIQDNVVIHCAEELPTLVERNATIGHSAQLEGGVVEQEIGRASCRER